MPRASYWRRRPTSGLPMPRMSLIASVAWIRPTTPGSTPSTPASLHDGAMPAGGGGEVQARGRAQAARTDEQHLRLEQLLLPLLAHVVEHQVARVTRLLLAGHDEGLVEREALVLPRLEAAGERAHVGVAELLQAL